MANRTDKDARSIHGTNPQNLIEKITRNKIYASVYWKKDCFGLSAETLVDKAVELKYVGGMTGEPQRPTEFMCLILKMLQIQPDKEIIIEFIKNDDYKYVRLLGAYYLRLVGKAYDVYTYLEPLYNDFRRVRLAQADGSFALAHVDEVVDDMLRRDYLFDVALPHIPLRHLLEKAGTLEPRVSLLDEDEVERAIAEAEAQAAEAAEETAAAREQLQAAAGAEERRERERERERERSRERARERELDLERTRERERERELERERERERERDRERGRDRDRERGGATAAGSAARSAAATATGSTSASGATATAGVTGTASATTGASATSAGATRTGAAAAPQQQPQQQPKQKQEPGAPRTAVAVGQPL
ncbi:PRP38 [Scenedesmus sp. PABB004]|nr:PRP38 [Scenedesmus sp. PABB004]